MKIELLFSKNWQNLEYKPTPKVQKLNTRQSSNTDSTVLIKEKKNCKSVSKKALIEFFLKLTLKSGEI